MPGWLMRMLWRCRGKRRVRLLPNEDGKPTVEGIRIGKWGGCHILVGATMIIGPDQTVTLDGVTEIAFDRVFATQVLS